MKSPSPQGEGERSGSTCFNPIQRDACSTIALARANCHLWVMDQTFTISGMHCGACVSKVTAALKPLADAVSVTLDPPRAVLTSAKPIAETALQAALAKIGTYGISAAAAPVTVVGDSGNDAPASWLQTYQPLLLIAGYIALASLAGTASPTGFDTETWMRHFMAGFFLVFSAFKFLNLAGFADAYASYDLLAKRWRAWGYVYPFLELALGLAYLFHVAPTATHIATILLMGFSSLGVIAALSNRQRIVCACLGTVLKLPMSTITLVEDLGMVGMAAAMLLWGGHN